jgi:hypothetical protein
MRELKSRRLGGNRSPVEGMAVDPNYRLRVKVKGADPPRFSPEPTCHVFGSNLVANCAEYYGSAVSPAINLFRVSGNGISFL